MALGLVIGGPACLGARAWLRAAAPGTPVAGAASAAQPHTHPIQQIPVVPDELLGRRVTRRDGIGAAHDAVGTASREAQAFFDQGLAYMHGYVWVEAARSLREALRHDPGLAMAHVALSLVYTELNLPDRAGDALARATALSGGMSAHDRQHLAVRQAQVAAEAAPRDAERLTAFRTAIERAVAAFPRDVELLLARGIAESSDPADRAQGAVAAGIPYFEQALAIAPGHAGAHHYLTHACENATRLTEAVRHAAAFAAAAPAIPHAQHMHGHALRRSGRIHEAIVAFEAAHALEVAYFRAEQVQPGQEWHHEHNLDLLAASYRYVGQMAKAGQLLETAFNTPSALAVQLFNKREWPEFLIAQGRTADALTAAGVLAGHPVTLIKATGHIEAARAMMAAKRFAPAAASANAALRALRTAADGAALVGPAFEAMQGEFFLRTGQRDKGRSMLQAVVAQLRAAPGPDNWAQALFAIEAMGRAARESDDWEFAAWAADQMLAHDALYAGSHFAVALVAEHNKQADRARAAYARAAALWQQADADLPERRLAMARGK